MVEDMFQPVSELPLAGARGAAGQGWRLPAAGGRFEIRLSRDPADIRAAQELRYRVFYQEMGASASAAARRDRLDRDEFDEVCDHLLVIDHSRPRQEAVVGTYRMLPQSAAERFGRFYSAGEFDLQPLLEQAGAGGGLLEVGRSCVHADYRSTATVKLLWRGIARYIADHGTTHLFGCASLPGCDPDRHAEALTYLHRHHRAPPELAVRALPGRYVAMDRLPAHREVDVRAAFRLLPPLVKAYLRLGCHIGHGAVIDREFGTTDVFILLPVDRIDPKYLTLHEGADAAMAF